MSQEIPKSNRNTFLTPWPDQQEPGRWDEVPGLGSLETCILAHVLMATGCVTLHWSLYPSEPWTPFERQMKGTKKGVSKAPSSFYDFMIIKRSFLLEFRLLPDSFLKFIYPYSWPPHYNSVYLSWSRLNAIFHMHSSQENVNSLS